MFSFCKKEGFEFSHSPEHTFTTSRRSPLSFACLASVESIISTAVIGVWPKEPDLLSKGLVTCEYDNRGRFTLGDISSF